MELRSIQARQQGGASLFIALLAFLALVLAGCASAPVRSGPVKQDDYEYMSRVLDWMLQTEMKRTSVPGVSIAVVDEQEIVWSKGYGVAEIGSSAPRKSGTATIFLFSVN